MSEQVILELEALSEPAPESVLPSVLVRTGLADEYTLVEGPSEMMYVSWSERGITSCVPASIAGDGASFEESHPRPAFRVDAPPSKIARPLDKALETGKLGTLPVDLTSLGEFQRKVLEKCAEIPPGEIRPYGWIAKEIGNPGAVRAVGTALGRNPVPILIPCHRVVRTDGRIGRYAYGTEMKRTLLEVEGIDTEGIERDAGKGLRYLGSDTTKVYCYPTCRAAKRITDSHKVEFRSEHAAGEAGYRPCKICRPIAAEPHKARAGSVVQGAR